jgi:hypothetical protein
VYGELPTQFPLSVASNWIFFNDVILKESLTIPRPLEMCPTNEFDPYLEGNLYQPPKVFWLWHNYPYPGLAANTWHEVIHEQDPFGDERHGAWFLYAPGSGVWFYTGHTQVFGEHQDAYKYFAATSNSDLALKASAAGFDSVQFSAHVDHVNYQCDSANIGKNGFDYMGFEIVGVKLVGTYACTTSSGAPSSIRMGWMASKTCSCDNSLQFLNCKGVPTSEMLHNFSQAIV